MDSQCMWAPETLKKKKGKKNEQQIVVHKNA